MEAVHYGDGMRHGPSMPSSMYTTLSAPQCVQSRSSFYTFFFTLFKLSIFPYPIPTECKFYVLVAQSCPIPSDSMNDSLPGSSVSGILQARTLEWVPIPFSRGSSNPGTELKSLALQADSLRSELPGKPKL